MFRDVRWVSLGIIAAAWAVILILPLTRPMAIRDARTLVGRPQQYWLLFKDLGIKETGFTLSPGEYGHPEGARLRVSARSDDFGLQLARALEWDGQEAMLARLRALAQRFPARADIYAHCLRFSWVEVRLRRSEDRLMTGDTSSYALQLQEQLPSPGQLARFLQDADAGERLDPDNAYFPLMRAVGLFAAHRDQEALAAVERASHMSRWDDYTEREAAEKWRLNEMAFGRQDALQKILIQGAVLLPHYAQLRSCCRVAAYQAVKREQAGKPLEGLAIREALLRCGGRMRAQSCNLIGSLYGAGIEETAISRPGSARPIVRPSGPPGAEEKLEDRASDERLERFAEYVQRLGQPGAEARAREAISAGRAVRTIGRLAEKRSPLRGEGIGRYALFSVGALVTLCASLWMLVMGCAAWILARARARPRATMLITALAFYLLGAVAWAHSRWTEVLVAAWGEMTGAAFGSTPAPSAGAAGWMALGLTAGAPALLTVGALVWAAARKRPLPETLCRLLLMAAAVTTLGFDVFAGLAARQEARMEEGVERAGRAEGRYLFELVGQQWPE